MIANPDPRIYLSPNYLVLDFETTGHARDPNADIVLACWTESKTCVERTESNRSPDLLLPYSPTIHKCAADVSRRFQREWGSCVSLALLRRAIEAADFVVAHNVKFEAGWLLRMGVDVRKITFYDTMLCEWVFFAGLPAKKGRLSLDGCAHRYSVGVKGSWCKMLLTKEVSTKDIPKKELLTYCLEDVSLTEALFKKQKQKLLELEAKAKEEEAKKDQEQNQKNKLKEQKQEQKPEGNIYKKASCSCSQSLRSSSCCFNSVGLHNIVYSRSMLAPVLADIELRGLQLDKLKVQTLYSEQIAKRQALSEKLYTLTGGINLGSDKQKATYLFDVLKFPSEGVARTKGNKQSTSLDTIRSLKATTEEQKQFQTMYLEYNDLDSSISKYLELFEGICSERNGLLLGELNQGRVSTHRLSSSGVPFKATGWKKPRSAQFQNLPREFKKLFVAKNKGWLIGECDGSQLEFRVAAGISGDEVAIKEICDLVDIHSVTASVLGVSRQDAKSRCVPMHSEILTQNGWKTYDTLNLDDKVAQYCSSTKAIVWGDVYEKVKYENQPVTRASTKHNWQLEATSNHRWYGFRRKEIAGGKRVFEDCEFTFDSLSTEHRFICSAPAKFQTSNGCSPEAASFIGWVISDGHYKFAPLTKRRSQGKQGQRRAHTCSIIQKKYKLEVQEMLSSLGIVCHESMDENGVSRWRVGSDSFRKVMAKAGLTPEEMESNLVLWVLGLSPEARKSFLKACLLAEGSIRKYGESRLSQNEGHRNDAMVLAGYLEGHDVRTVIRKKEMNPMANFDNHITTFRKKAHVTCQNLRLECAGKQDVWCPRTEYGSWVMRQGKVISITGNTFSPLYGGNGKTKAERKYCQFFRDKYKKISSTQKRWALDVVSSHAKELTLPYGITYHFPEARMQADGYIVGTTNIYNFPIQGLATAECIPIALTYMWHRLPESGIEIVNTVHDSIIAEVRPDMVEVWKALCIEAMTFAVYRILESLYHYKLEVPLGIGTKIGNYWGDGIEQTFQVDNSILYEVVKDSSGTKVRVPVQSPSS